MSIIINKLLSYYQIELSYLKKYGIIFSQRFPKIAKRLGYNDGVSEDPHVERLVESFALLTAQIHQRLDEEMPEFTYALLTTLAPYLLRPFPSVCIVKFAVDQRLSGMTQSFEIPSNTQIRTTLPAEEGYRFRTLYPVTLNPIDLHEAKFQLNEKNQTYQLNMYFEVWSGAALSAKKIRLHLNGVNTVVNIIYTLLSAHVYEAQLYIGDQKVMVLTQENISAVGFAEGENLITKQHEATPTHELLLDYFLFPQKFHFIDIIFSNEIELSEKREFSLRFSFKQHPIQQTLTKIHQTIDKSFFQLGCTPVINLFEQRAEPITPSLTMAEYPIIPNVRHKQQIEVWSVDQVEWLSNQNQSMQEVILPPLFGLWRQYHETTASTVYWQALVRSVKGDIQHQQFYLGLSYKNCLPFDAEDGVISVHLTCSNRNLPAQLTQGVQQLNFESQLPLSQVVIHALTKPTHPIYPPSDNDKQWQLISLLNLNQQLLGGVHKVDTLKQMLSLYNFHHSLAVSRLIAMIIDVKVKSTLARLVRLDPTSLARGIEITIIFESHAKDDEEYCLFVTVLERFLGLYAPVNGFCRLVSCIEGYDEFTQVWPIRAGRLSWL